MKRKSIRSYTKESLAKEDLSKIKKIIKTYESKNGPFNHQAKFFLTQKKDHSSKIGTYGFIKNAQAFIGGIIENKTNAMIDYGYLFEHIILEITKINLGTCWLGGTFKRSDFDVDLQINNIIPAVSPIGYSSNPSLREKVIRRFAKADNRLPIEKLFFNQSDLTPIKKDHPMIKYLRAIQAAPSASNKQPWRVTVSNQFFHIFLKRNEGYGKQLEIDIQAIDIGIAVSHLTISLEEDGYQPKFIKKTIDDFEDASYIITVKTSK